MCRRSRLLRLLVALFLAAGAGCANVKVKKVSVEDRLSGEDYDVKGFRYYLTRPYLAVSRRIEVAKMYVPVQPARKPGDKALYFVPLVTDPETMPKDVVYNQRGEAVKVDDLQVITVVTAREAELSNDPPDSTPPALPGETMHMYPEEELKNEPPKEDPSKPPPPAIQVVNLPDFEEQYAIRNKNLLAKTQYRYQFENSSLATMAGSYNATDVPVAIVETVGKLIEAAGKVATKAIETAPLPKGREFEDDKGPRREFDPFYLKVEYTVEPGFYRVNKSWERVAGVAPEGLLLPQLSGLLGDLGLPVKECRSVISGARFAHEAGLVPLQKSDE